MNRFVRAAVILLAVPTVPTFAQTAQPAQTAQTAPTNPPATVTAPAEDGLLVRGAKEQKGMHCYTTGGQPVIGSLIPRKPKQRKCAQSREEQQLLAQSRSNTDRDVREMVRPMGGTIYP